jgi:hypothetical protein
VNETWKSKLKSLPCEDAEGNVQPMRRLYACSFARRFSFIRVETLALGDLNPRQFLPPSRQFVAAPRHFFLLLEQRQPGGQSFLVGADFVS